MKQEDINRLKEICEENGFEIKSESQSGLLYYIDKKDPWEGVEFAKGLVNIEGHLEKNKCFKIIKIAEKWNDGHKHVFFYRNGQENYTHTSNVTPITESEYVEQLKKEALSRFNSLDEIDYSDLNLWKLDTKISWVYNKIDDTFHWCGVPVYCAGKWAKVVERVKVSFCWNKDEKRDRVYFNFHKHTDNDYEIGPSLFTDDDPAKVKAIGDFLSKKLEKYLNDNQE